jgi:hypothetical protein
MASYGTRFELANQIHTKVQTDTSQHTNLDANNVT